jgi:hypothetical protein
MAPDLLSTIRAEIAERMDGLHPLLAEHEQLLAAAEALDVTTGGEETPADVATNGSAPPRTRPAKLAEMAASQAFDAANAVLGGKANGKAPETAHRAVKQVAAKVAAKPARATRGAAREAILAALEHGSHTIGELSVVTAMTGPNINGNLRRLLDEGVVVKTEREGKAAWALVERVA